MYKRKRLRSAREVVEALGGTTEAAKFLRVGPSQVSNMLKRGIPPNHHKRIELYLDHLGYEIDHERVFGYSLETLLMGLSEGDGRATSTNDEMHAA